MTNVQSDTASEEVVGQAADGGMRTGNVAINGKSHFGGTAWMSDLRPIREIDAGPHDVDLAKG
jgi:hypothetical protein